MRGTWILIVALGVGTGCQKSDPCSGTSGACLGVLVKAATSAQASSLEVSVTLGTAPPVTRTTMPPGGPTGFPLAFALVLGSYAGPVGLGISTRLSDGSAWQGAASASVAAGMHGSVEVDLSTSAPDGGQDMGVDMAPAGPQARTLPALAPFPDPRQSVIMLGGRDAGGTPLDETWEWTSMSWQRVQSAQRPQARAGGAMAFDSVRKAVVLFGGFTGAAADPAPSGETWLFTSRGLWEPFAAGAGPSPRGGAGLAYDSVRSTLVLFGGSLDGVHPLFDTWELPSAQAAWHPVTGAAAAPAVHTPTLVFDGSRVLLVGSDDQTVVKVWAYTPATGNWTQLQPSGMVQPPPARQGAAVAFDPGPKAIVVSGGAPIAGTMPPSLGDLYYFTIADNQWHGVQVDPGTGPGPRQEAGMALAPVEMGLLLFGGRVVGGTQVRTYGDTWLLDGGTLWSLATP